MTTELESFLASHLPFPGLAAWSVRLSGHPPVHQACVRWISPAQLEEVMARLAVALEGLRYQQLEPLRLSWAFQHLRLYLVQRHDGGCLALVVENRQDLPATALKTVLAEFANLPVS